MPVFDDWGSNELPKTDFSALSFLLCPKEAVVPKRLL